MIFATVEKSWREIESKIQQDNKLNRVKIHQDNKLNRV